MLTTLVAALSLAASMALDVPYLPQTDALCGGAAAAMVFRYWGDAHADPQQFASLIDRRAGGIGSEALTAAIAARGWRTARVGGSLADLGARVGGGQPVIVLLPDRGTRYHYVVVTAVDGEAIVVHDPAWGPSRRIRAPDFEREWKASGYWSLAILPPSVDGGSKRTRPTGAAESVDPPAVGRVFSEPQDVGRVLSDPPSSNDACDVKLNRALDEIRARGLDHADTLLGEVRAACPASAGPLRELSGVRFAERRWSDAAALARDALRREPHDAYALDVLGSSLFMLNDDLGALRAWNQIGKPRVNRVRIEGLHHIRYQTVGEVMAIQPNMLLTAALFERARHRLGELPDHAVTRLAIKPEADGFATVDVVVLELAAMPHGPVEWIGAAARALSSREIDVSVPGVSGQGEVWSAGWRWWSDRPGVNVGFAAPRPHGMPGVWRVEAAWQSDTYAAGSQTSTIVESRTHGGLTMSDWLPHGLRYNVSTGVDAWSGGRKAASIGAGLEHRAFGDRLSLSIDATQWAPLSDEAAFRSVAARATVRSSTDTRGWVSRGSIGIERVTDTAPLSLWPGAGEGLVRTPLLRAHPLLNEGIVDLDASSAFGRTLAYGSGEVQRWMDTPILAKFAIAGFTDIARATRRAAAGDAPMQIDVGAGLRVKIPGTPGVLRVDVAHGVRDGANALTFGWLF